MGRRAVAATLVSVVVFTSLLLANSALYSAENSAVSAAVLTSEQVRENAYAGILLGLSTYDSLAAVQGYLHSNPLDCSSPGHYLDALAGSQRATGTDEGISYITDTSWAYASAPPAGTGSAFLPGFSSYEAGELNLEVTTSLDESYDSGLPSYSVQTAETVHLSVPLTYMISDCLAALAELRGALSALPYCNSTGVESALELAESSDPHLESFSVGASATPLSPGCAVEYRVTTTLSGLQGVSGAFQWTVLGEGAFEI
ncbi:MAG: hypothetical protein ABSG45_00670 [Nitrososphaerales archaeon]